MISATEEKIQESIAECPDVEDGLEAIIIGDTESKNLYIYICTYK